MVLTHPGAGYSFNPARHFPTHWESQMQEAGFPESLLQCISLSQHPSLLHGAGSALILLLVQTRPQQRHPHACLHGSGVIQRCQSTSVVLGGVNVPMAHLAVQGSRRDKHPVAVLPRKSFLMSLLPLPPARGVGYGAAHLQPLLPEPGLNSL